MSFLERVIKNGIKKGIGDAVSKAVQQAVEPKATELANKAAEQLDQASQSAAQQTTRSSSELEGAFANLRRSIEDYATEVSKNVVCSKCGKQNVAGTRFCQECGEKLPAAVADEQIAAENDEDVFKQWEKVLPQYPVWNCGGWGFEIEEFDGAHYFTACFESSFDAQNAVKKYRETLIQSGFRQAGESPNVEHLYKMIDGKCYHADTEHCFDSDSNAPTIGFSIDEPTGGFNR